MSSAVVSTSAARGRPFFFDDEAEAEASCGDSRPRLSGRAQLDWRSPASKIFPSAVTPASRLETRPAPEMAPSGIPAIDALTGGLPRGCLTEICGPASSGRTTLLLAALAAATARGEFCVVVDASDALDPHSVVAAGVDLDRLLWVRCGDNSVQKSRAKEKKCPISRVPSAREAYPEPVEWVGTSPQAVFKFSQTASRQAEHRLDQLLRATDLLLESGGFGLIVLDLCDVTPQAARRIPLTTWFRFRRAVEYKPTVLLAFEQHPIAGSCSSLLLKLGPHTNPESAMNNQEGAMKWKYSDSSSEAAAFVSPARKHWERAEKQNESRRACPEQAKRVEGDGTTANNAMSQNPRPAHSQLLTRLEITARLERSRLERKPARPASIAFASKTAWTG